MTSEDALVTIAACTPLGREKGAPDDPKPLGAKEWTALVRRVVADSKATPGDLLGLDAAEMAERFGLEESLAPRVVALLRGAGSVGVALERLETTGIWTLTRGDGGYPDVLKRKLGASAPPVLFGAGPQDLPASVEIS